MEDSHEDKATSAQKQQDLTSSCISSLTFWITPSSSAHYLNNRLENQNP